jgi:putative transposase
MASILASFHNSGSTFIDVGSRFTMYTIIGILLYRPNTVITDGAPNFHDAFMKELFTLGNPRTRHIAHIRLQGDHNNNKMERMNGEVRDREKVMRGLKRTDTSVLTGYQIYHNYFRPHEALNGKTPAEKCGIIIEGQDKWKTVIENASMTKEVEKS